MRGEGKDRTMARYWTRTGKEDEHDAGARDEPHVHFHLFVYYTFMGKVRIAGGDRVRTAAAGQNLDRERNMSYVWVRLPIVITSVYLKFFIVRGGSSMRWVIHSSFRYFISYLVTASGGTSQW